MKFGLKSMAAATVMAVASTTAFAQIVVPPQPVPGPTIAPSTGNGGLIVAAWDEVRGVSLVQYLGLRLDDVRPDADMLTAGTLLNFGTLSSFSTVFGASTSSNIQYMVVAGDSTGTVNLNKNLAVTINGASTSYTINNAATSGAAGQMNNFITTAMNGSGGCNGANPCIALSNADLQYAGNPLSGLGAQLGGQLPLSSAGTIGTALHFAFIGASGSVGSANAPTQVYQAAGGGAFGEWLLTTNGQLTYSVAAVPLPAALWLLLSGLAGFGVIGRRKAA